MSIIYFILAFVLTILILILLNPFFNNHFLVVPNSRSSHSTPKPTGGGISFVIVSSFLMLFLKNFLPLICLPLAIVGFIDDLKNLDFRLRFSIQMLTGFIIWSQSNFLANNQIVFESKFILLFYFLIAFVITAIINFTNFVDGIDGLLVSSMLISFFVVSIKVHSSLWVIVGSLLAFLFFNWHPSKIFMGDVGSTFLGAVYSGIILQASSWQDSLFILLPLLPLLSDAFVCVVRRFFAEENIFKSHSLHLFQRLYQAGWSHSKIAFVYSFVALILALFSLFDLWYLSAIAIFIIYSFAIYLDQKVAVSFNDSLQKSKN